MSVCHTDPANPSVSLIMSICHLESFHFTTAATEWGCQHEKNTKNQSNHVEFNVTSAGFFISTEFPYVGASPDGVVECSCCGRGIYEIKVRAYSYK